MILFNIPDDGENKFEFGSFKVELKRETKIKRENRLASLIRKPGATLLLMLIIIAGVAVIINLINNTDEIATDYYDLQDDVLQDYEIHGNWRLVSRVESISDFDADDLNAGVNADWQTLEFFDDSTALLSGISSEQLFIWIKYGDPLRFLPGLITVSEIKPIDGRDFLFVGFSRDSGYYVLRRIRARHLSGTDDVRNRDIRNHNFSSVGLLHTLRFNENTRFPSDKVALAIDIMERGKNPGLGVRSLHERGITGMGVNVGVIDEALILGHPEYYGKIIEYRNFGSADSSMQGAAIVSLLAGENIGVAPGANIFYAAVPAWDMFDATYYANALDWIIELNESLPDDEKIRVVCITPNPENPLPWINVYRYLESFRRATEAGILVLDVTSEHGVVIGASRYNFNYPEDVTLSTAMRPYRIFIASNHYDDVSELYINDENMLRAPISFRTMAEISDDGEFSYKYDGVGRLSWAVAYVTGVLAMGWQVSPELTPDEIISILFSTAHIDESNNKYIHPVAFIEYLENN